MWILLQTWGASRWFLFPFDVYLMNRSLQIHKWKGFLIWREVLVPPAGNLKVLQASYISEWGVKCLVAKSDGFFATPCAVAHQAHLSMGFSRQEYWSELPFPSPGDLPDPAIEPASAALLVDSQPWGVKVIRKNPGRREILKVDGRI